MDDALAIATGAVLVRASAAYGCGIAKLRAITKTNRQASH
jgi:hypothetical protein